MQIIARWVIFNLSVKRILQVCNAGVNSGSCKEIKCNDAFS